MHLTDHIPQDIWRSHILPFLSFPEELTSFRRVNRSFDTLGRDAYVVDQLERRYDLMLAKGEKWTRMYQRLVYADGLVSQEDPKGRKIIYRLVKHASSSMFMRMIFDFALVVEKCEDHNYVMQAIDKNLLSRRRVKGLDNMDEVEREALWEFFEEYALMATGEDDHDYAQGLTTEAYETDDLEMLLKYYLEVKMDDNRLTACHHA